MCTGTESSPIWVQRLFQIESNMTATLLQYVEMDRGVLLLRLTIMLIIFAAVGVGVYFGLCDEECRDAG